MELPPYRFTNVRTILQNMFTRAGLFIKRAGTVILAISIILWALTYFPQHAAEEVQSSMFNVQSQTSDAGAETASVADADENALASERLKNSYAGKIGRFIEPAIKPLGFDWKIGIGLIASFGAREVVISTMGIIYSVGKDSADDTQTLTEAFRDAKRDDGSPEWTPLTALTLMVFFVLAMQCASTVAVVRRETNSWRWAIFMVAYMTALAYLAAFFTFQSGRLLGFE